MDGLIAKIDLFKTTLEWILRIGKTILQVVCGVVGTYINITSHMYFPKGSTEVYTK